LKHSLRWQPPAKASEKKEDPMSDRGTNEIEIASDQEVRQAALGFANALLQTGAFQEYEAASERLSKDSLAQNAIQAFQQKQQYLQAKGAQSPISAEERAELETLRGVFMVMPVVVEYLNAQSQAVAICQSAGDLLSEGIGMNFASSACTGGCCG
jgi:cell fate (sporulation/competence/biofilm development) regulator YlbF (YheA/YmcA/DUF963 family)